MRTTNFSSVPSKFLAALAIIAMLLAILPAMPAYAAAITVNTLTDENVSNGSCSLREAIIAANNNAAHNGCSAGSAAAVDIITLASGSTYVLSLVGTTTSLGDLDITDPAGLTIQASSTTPAIIDANDIDRVLDVTAAAGNLTLSYITVQNGNTTGQSTTTGGGISFGSTATLTLTNSNVLSNIATNIAGCGAGIHNNTAATVNIVNSTIADNICAEAGSDGGGLFKGGSGGTLIVTNSTFTGNSTNENGGAIHLGDGTATITNSTFTANVASNRGGALQVGAATATATIEFSTFSGNAANGGVTNNNGGSIQVSAGSVAINRSILANSVAGMDCDRSIGASAVFTNSLVENNNDCTGTPTSTADPMLGLLASNGGPTQTMGITTASPAYNAAASCNSITTDQRGIARPQAGFCDLGAFEAGPPTVVSILRASPNPISTATVDYTVTFSEAVTGVGSADFTLTVDGVSGASVSSVTGSGTTYTVTVDTGAGTGTIRLDVPVSATILDLDGNSLAGLPYESGQVYDKTSGAPAATTLISPNGTIATNNPTYIWNKVSAATWYYIYIQGPSGNLVYAEWYSSAAVCGASQCSIANLKPDGLAPGTHRWWVQTWNGTGGYGPWSAGMNFTVPTPTPPAATTLVSPNGSITTNNPTYTWNKVAAATWYNLYVSGPSGYVFSEWYSSAAVCGATQCSIANATTLAAGEHRWWVQTWNGTGGYGPWSTGMTFTTTPPAAATLNTPNGVTTSSPTYNWNKVNEATWYYIYIQGPSGNLVHADWYSSATACAGSTCSIVGATPGLTSGQYRWWIQTWNSVGYGPWSSGLNFSVP